MPNSISTARGHLDKTPTGQPHALSDAVSARKRHHRKMKGMQQLKSVNTGNFIAPGDQPAPKDDLTFQIEDVPRSNACLKPTPSTLPLATNEIKKPHHWNFYLKADAANAFWSIPLDDESRRMTAFQTHEGIFA